MLYGFGTAEEARAQALYDKLRNPVQPLWVRNANHSNIFSRELASS
jgi:hypothetical protein